MTSLSKIAGVVVAASGVTYGVLAYVDYSKHDTVVRQYESRIKSWESDLNSMQQDVNGKTEKLMAITKDAESDQQKVKALQNELKSKQEELKAVERKLSESQDSLTAKMRKATEARKAINDLRAAITDHSGKQDAWALEMAAAKLTRQKTAEKWNPLTSPHLKQLFGRSNN